MQQVSVEWWPEVHKTEKHAIFIVDLACCEQYGIGMFIFYFVQDNKIWFSE